MREPRWEIGPFTRDQIQPGDRYEIVDGHAFRYAPAGGRHASASLTGALLATDPLVVSAGTDAGFSPDERNVHAPDVAIGNVSDEKGWVKGTVPPLALEYADDGQDEASLQAKIASLLAHGTRHVWVARLTGPRRVEVYEPGAPVRVRGLGDLLSAPGVLRNAVPVEALFDRDAGLDLALTNLLQRHGYDSLEAVRVEEARAALRRVFARRGLAPTDAEAARIDACRDRATLEAWLDAAVTAATVAEALG
jgi:hypothetical protein